MKEDNIMIKKTITISFAVFFLTGCGETYWSHNIKGETEFYSDKNSCISQANAAYPIRKSQPTYTGSSTNCYGYGNSLNCTTTPTPNYFANVDWNESARRTYHEDCLKSKGWQEQEQEKKSDNSLSSLLDGIF
jgi:hypothetical protein